MTRTKALDSNHEIVRFTDGISLILDALDTLNYIHKYKNEDDYSSIAILGYKDLIQYVFNLLYVIKTIDNFNFNNFDLKSIKNLNIELNFLDFDVIDYSYEYGLILTIENDKYELSIEKAKYNDGGYKSFDMDYIYISSDCGNELKDKNIIDGRNIDIFMFTEKIV